LMSSLSTTSSWHVDAAVGAVHPISLNFGSLAGSGRSLSLTWSDADARGCVKTILRAIWAQIDSNRTLHAHQRVMDTTTSILLLRDDDCSQRFYTAWP